MDEEFHRKRKDASTRSRERGEEGLRGEEKNKVQRVETHVEHL